jgi:hypothetical protein
MISPSPQAASLKKALTRADAARARYVFGRLPQDKYLKTIIDFMSHANNYMRYLSCAENDRLEGEQENEFVKAQTKAGENENE